MKRAFVAAGAVALLMLTGCTSTVSEEPITVTPGASGSSSADGVTAARTPSATGSPAPAAPVEVTATTPPPPKTADTLIAIQLTVSGYDVVVNADQIKTAADYTCDQIAAGVDESSIVALTGDIPAGANDALVQMSADYYCPTR